MDCLTAKQHLSNVAKAVWGPTSELGKEWAQERHAELEKGRLDHLIAALTRHAENSDQARQCTDYIQKNRHRMNYPAFRARGLSTSSGVLEAGCKLAIGTRMKRAGMHGSLHGAHRRPALLPPLSGRFEDFWQRRVLKAA